MQTESEVINFKHFEHASVTNLLFDSRHEKRMFAILEFTFCWAALLESEDSHADRCHMSATNKNPRDAYFGIALKPGRSDLCLPLSK